MKNELRPFWGRFFSFNWKFGLFLILIICIPRFILVLRANATGNYGSIGLIMAISAIAPFIFLSKVGRREIGITKPTNHRWLFFAFILGLLVSICLYLLGEVLYGIPISANPIIFPPLLASRQKPYFLPSWLLQE